MKAEKPPAFLAHRERAPRVLYIAAERIFVFRVARGGGVEEGSGVVIQLGFASGPGEAERGATLVGAALACMPSMPRAFSPSMPDRPPSRSMSRCRSI